MNNKDKQRAIRFLKNNNLREVRFIDEDGCELVDNVPMVSIKGVASLYYVIRAFVVGNDICIDLFTDDSMNEWEQIPIQGCDEISQMNVYKSILETSL